MVVCVCDGNALYVHSFHIILVFLHRDPIRVLVFLFVFLLLCKCFMRFVNILVVVNFVGFYLLVLLLLISGWIVFEISLD